jgi:hypothetical protein
MQIVRLAVVPADLPPTRGKTKEALGSTKLRSNKANADQVYRITECHGVLEN